MHGTEAMMARLQALKGVGARLAIDDFGTGYSSLSYLQQFPIDILKIAKPFVDSLTTEVGGTARPALARAIVALGQTLGLQTIAEGIEVRSQTEALLALGCELGQGYFYATPLSVEQMQQLIVERGGRTLPLPRLERGARRSDAGRPQPTDPPRARFAAAHSGS
jgi:EAL domain-containing protein (putative c-di-GMP-specific phosphodiesterase class I)